MKLTCTWNEKMAFTAEAGEHQVRMDTQAPLGSNSAMSPKQLVLAAICGCTGIDVVSLLRKYQQKLEGLEMEANAKQNETGYPKVFREVHLVFRFRGEMDSARVLEAVRLSQTQYCGVSAMIARGAPISYEVWLNDREIGRGHAEFS
jgi:putative redox protein